MFQYSEEYSHPTCICLNVTDNCNLACRYCFVQQHPHYMPLDIAIKAVDWIMENKKWKDERGISGTTPSVNFFGGEPTLLWDEIIVPVTKYIRSTYNKDKIYVGMTTNGTLLNKERISFIKDNELNVLLSIDGPKEVQDYNRPTKNGGSSFDLLEDNILPLLNDHPYITFRSTIYQPTVDQTYKVYHFAEKAGFKNIFMCPNSRDPWDREQLFTLNREINKIILDRILHYMGGVEPINSTQIDKAFLHIFEHDMSNYISNYTPIGQERKPTRCGLGSTSASVAYDGKIYACQEQDSRSMNDLFYIGDIDNGIDPVKHEKILSMYATDKLITCAEKPNLCKDCKARLSCIDFTCPSTSWDLYKDFFKRPEVDCRMTQWLIEGALHTMKLLVEREPNELFKKYLNNLYKMEGQ